jgi:ABC-type multidrug transport system ATPase subunit
MELTYRSHRLSTVMNADTIFVVANGQVVEEGSHESLIAKRGKYAELWSKQIFVKPKEQKEGTVVVQEVSYTNEQPNDTTNGDITEASLSEASKLLSMDKAEMGPEGFDSSDSVAVNTLEPHKNEVDPSKDQC